MKNTIPNYGKMKEVMADLRENEARCCLIYRDFKDNESWANEVSIRAVLKDGRIWDIHDIESCCGKNEAVVHCATE